MTGPFTQTCHACHEELVLAMDPAAPPDEECSVLLADPPFRYVCVSATCSSSERATGP